MSTASKEERKLLKGKHRLFKPIYDISLVLQAVQSHYFLIFTNGQWKFEEGARIGFAVKQKPKMVILPATGAVEQIIAKQECQFISMQIETFAIRPGYAQVDDLHPGLMNLYTNAVAPFFLRFYETYRKWIAKRFGTAQKKWPEFFIFVWAIRNAISHRGQLNWSDPSIPSARWGDCRYSCADDGKAIFETDITVGDLILLIIELSDSLDQMACPLELP